MIGRSRQLIMLSRKVRAPKGKPPGNAWASLIREQVMTDSATENRPPAAFCR